ncbi:MAG: hypothetical protein J0G37_06920, partial [Afipia sp.]|nr:hypothetical protein [Afipia sp.]
MEKSKTPVYKLVSGQLVRKDKDETDPNRRYSATNHPHTGENILREFTDEEEQQRDLEEAQWRADAP